MNVNDLEELVVTIRQFIQKARNCNDVFEYCRLCDELTFAESALNACAEARSKLSALISFGSTAPALYSATSN